MTSPADLALVVFINSFRFELSNFYFSFYFQNKLNIIEFLSLEIIKGCRRRSLNSPGFEDFKKWGEGGVKVVPRPEFAIKII